MDRHVIARKYRRGGLGGHDSFEDRVFIDCTFEECVAEGASIDSIFVHCLFHKQDWYWAIAHAATFVDCRFVQCDLRGSFYDTYFIRCQFEDCMTGEDNMGGKTTWEGAKAIDCTLIRTSLPIVARGTDSPKT